MEQKSAHVLMKEEKNILNGSHFCHLVFGGNCMWFDFIIHSSQCDLMQIRDGDRYLVKGNLGSDSDGGGGNIGSMDKWTDINSRNTVKFLFFEDRVSFFMIWFWVFYDIFTYLS